MFYIIFLFFDLQCFALDLSLINLISLNLLVILNTLRHLVDILECKARELLGRLEKHLLETHTDTKLVVNEPNLVNLDDASDALTLLDGGHVHILALVIVRLGDKLTSLGIVEHLELHGCRVLTLARSDNGLVERLLDDRNRVLLPEPLDRVVGNHLDDNLIECLHLVHEVLDLGVDVKRQGKGIRSLLGSLVGESAQAKWCAHLGRLKMNLRVAGTVEVHRATTILVLANLGEDDSGGSELSRLLN